MSSDHGRRAQVPAQRLSVVTEPDLLAALQMHQRVVERTTGLRVSLSQVAGSLMRRGLDRSSAEQQPST